MAHGLASLQSDLSGDNRWMSIIQQVPVFRLRQQLLDHRLIRLACVVL